MTLQVADGRRCLPVRLTEIKLGVRCAAARLAAKHEDDGARAELLACLVSDIRIELTRGAICRKC